MIKIAHSVVQQRRAKRARKEMMARIGDPDKEEEVKVVMMLMMLLVNLSVVIMTVINMRKLWWWAHWAGSTGRTERTPTEEWALRRGCTIHKRFSSWPLCHYSSSSSWFQGLQNALAEEHKKHHGHQQRHHKERRPSMCQNLAKRSKLHLQHFHKSVDHL